MHALSVSLIVSLMMVSVLALFQIKKFKDALAKHTPDRCSLGPTKGLEEKELAALAANKDLSFTYTPKKVQPAPVPVAEEEVVPATAASHSDGGLPPLPLTLPLPITSLKSAQDSEEKTLAISGRWCGVVSHQWPPPYSPCTVCTTFILCQY